VFSVWLESGCCEARLRAVGWLADAAGVERMLVREEGQGLVVHGRRIDAPDAEEAPARLTPRDLQQVLAMMARLRGVEAWSVPRTRVLAPADTPCPVDSDGRAAALWWCSGRPGPLPSRGALLPAWSRPSLPSA
jgi:hypothetical protein